MTVINASAAVTLLQRPKKKISGSERDSNPRCRCSTLPTELSKPRESGRIRVSPLNVDVILGPSIVKSEINFLHIILSIYMDKINFALYYTWAKL